MGLSECVCIMYLYALYYSAERNSTLLHRWSNKANNKSDRLVNKYMKQMYR